MGTPVTDFIDPVRVWLGDNDDTYRLYSDDVINRGVRVAIKGGDLEDYELSADLLSIEPEITDPNTYMLLAAKVARRFIGSQPSSQSSATRAFRESVGNYRGLVMDLDDAILRLDNEGAGGGMFDGWDTCYRWISCECGSCSTSEDYTHFQSLPATTWIIDHELGKRPAVVVTDMQEQVIVPSEIQYQGTTRVTITFSEAVAGWAHLS